jgi:hypothetical protein
MKAPGATDRVVVAALLLLIHAFATVETCATSEALKSAQEVAVGPAVRAGKDERRLAGTLALLER